MDLERILAGCGTWPRPRPAPARHRFSGFFRGGRDMVAVPRHGAVVAIILPLHPSLVLHDPMDRVVRRALGGVCVPRGTRAG